MIVYNIVRLDIRFQELLNYFLWKRELTREDIRYLAEHQEFLRCDTLRMRLIDTISAMVFWEPEFLDEIANEVEDGDEALFLIFNRAERYGRNPEDIILPILG